MIPAKGKYVFSSESVTEGHPDKVADQISDAILDTLLEQDPDSHVACETLVTTGMAVIAGEITTSGYADLPHVVRETIKNIGYNSSDMGFDYQTCAVLSSIDKQSVDIAQGVNRTKPEDQGAGDQGMMFGYATNETPLYIPLTLALSHALLKELSRIRHEGKEFTYTDKNGVVRTYLRPDSKSQVTVEYDEEHRPVRVHTIVISTQHDDFIEADGELTQEEADRKMLGKIREDVKRVLIPAVKAKLPADIAALIDDEFILHVNPTGKFVVGGPHGDTGLTGRKIIVDTYGGHGAHGGGAFSGKDPSKVDRSAAYAARHIAKNLVAAGVADRALVQVAYAIGVAQPVSLYVDTQGTSKVNMSDAEISKKVSEIFDMTPHGIETRLGLRNPIYLETATYGHFGRTPRKVTKHFHSAYEEDKTVEVELFTWEKLDYVDKIRETFK